MSSDGKPLWGFRKIFFLLGISYCVAAVWIPLAIIHPGHGSATPAGLSDYLLPVTIFLVASFLGAGHLRYWHRLRQPHYTPRLWHIGLLLLLPAAVIPPFGFLCLISWCAQTCKLHFFPREQVLAGRTNPCDAVPLWGFRVLFCTLASFFGISAIMTVVELIHPSPRQAALNPPGSINHTAWIIIAILCALTSTAQFWFWRQLLHRRFTPRNWIIGLILLIPSLIVPAVGIISIVSWSVESCTSRFYGRPPPPSRPPA